MDTKRIVLIVGGIAVIIGISILLYLRNVQRNTYEPMTNSGNGSGQVTVGGITIPVEIAKDIVINEGGNPKCTVLEDEKGNKNPEAMKACEGINK